MSASDPELVLPNDEAENGRRGCLVGPGLAVEPSISTCGISEDRQLHSTLENKLSREDFMACFSAQAPEGQASAWKQQANSSSTSTLECGVHITNSETRFSSLYQDLVRSSPLEYQGQWIDYVELRTHIEQKLHTNSGMSQASFCPSFSSIRVRDFIEILREIQYLSVVTEFEYIHVV